MKTYLLLISLSICSIINAQTPDWWPSHPLETHIGDKPGIQPDTVITRLGKTDTDDKAVITFIHCYGDNGYIDTTRVICTDNRIILDYRAYILTYAKENNKLISEKKYPSGDFSGISDQIFYEYDSTGRRIKEYYISYNEKEIITRNETIIYDFSTVHYTDSGYIYDGVIYCLDEKGRLIKEISGGDTTPTYISTYIYNDRGYDIIRDTDAWCFIGYLKTECFFDDNGLLSKLINYTQTEIHPEGETTDYSYYFSPGNTTSNSLVANIPVIYGTTGSLIVNTEQPEQISIYAISGQLVKKEYISGNKQIPLPGGIYIVKSTNKTYKIVIK